MYLRKNQYVHSHTLKFVTRYSQGHIYWELLYGVTLQYIHVIATWEFYNWMKHFRTYVD